MNETKAVTKYYLCAMNNRGQVRAKKYLGQHFLKDESIAERIANVVPFEGVEKVLEIGPGMGVMTKYLLDNPSIETWVVEIDDESVSYLKAHYNTLSARILEEDFLRWNPSKTFGEEKFALVGNFPYNISSQIVFKVLDHRDQIPLFGGMFQKEVAQRLCSPPGNKTYGILSVLCQAYYDLTYDFTVPPGVFNPPPKVDSGVMHMVRKTEDPNIDFKLLKRGVKAAFGMRRKTLRNALKVLNLPEGFEHPYLSKRAEQLSHTEFVELLTAIEDGRNEH
jgi:16S rRNA (adenine1518-N6/adenine1519-N6)-dimethyltransferase